VNRDKDPICFQVPWNKTIPQAKIKITIVLMAVAKLESTFLMPILAKIAVRAAKNADSNAGKSQLTYLL
jgi:hypothetical protein